VKGLIGIRLKGRRIFDLVAGDVQDLGDLVDDGTDLDGTDVEHNDAGFLGVLGFGQAQLVPHWSKSLEIHLKEIIRLGDIQDEGSVDLRWTRHFYRTGDLC